MLSYCYCYWHCQHSIRNRVYVTVRYPSVCLSLRLSVPARAHSSKPAAVGPASRRYRSIAAAAACDGRTVRCAVRVKDRLYLTTCASIPLQIRIFYNRDERITDFIQLTVAHITTVILWQDYYIKMHTDSVTYVIANSRPSFFFFIVQTLSFMHCTCNFIRGLSDVIIKTFSQSVSQFFTGRMPFLLPNQQCQSTEGLYIIRR